VNKGSFPEKYHNKDDGPPLWAAVIVYGGVAVLALTLWALILVGIVALGMWILGL
jgi:hypothetical protein